MSDERVRLIPVEPVVRGEPPDLDELRIAGQELIDSLPEPAAVKEPREGCGCRKPIAWTNGRDSRCIRCGEPITKELKS